MIPPPKRHGSVAVGRTIVVAVCLGLSAMNFYLFRAAQLRVHPLPMIAVPAVVIFFWMLAGGAALYLRRVWGRYFLLVVLCLGSITFGVGGILITLNQDEIYNGMPEKLFITVAVYTAVTLVLTSSQHVRRLTSRIWD